MFDRHQAANDSAINWQKANKSDPFAGRVAFTHIVNGVCAPSDYNAQFRKEEVESSLAAGVKYSREVASSMVRA